MPKFQSERPIAQIAISRHDNIVAVANDGTAWTLKGEEWEQLPPLPTVAIHFPDSLFPSDKGFEIDPEKECE